ncbi:serine-rich adhesin for platelets-like [Clinocottus analis]|uniref:serine-rich adhesin for platelets-like n=1 Tax=Clinocottus analis TaxID=304258 RepID=UPI0035BED90A
MSLNGSAAPVFWLKDECFPDVSLLDDTCGSPFPGSMPATPVTAGPINSRFTSLQPSQLSFSTDLNTTAQIPCTQLKSRDLLKSKLSSPKVESQTFNAKPSRQTGPETSETSSSHDAQENNSEVHSQHNRTENTDPDEKMVDLSENMFAGMRWMDGRFCPEITLLDLTRESEVSHEGELSSMEVTQENIFENRRPSLEPSDSNMVKIQTSAEETFDTLSSDVTPNINDSSAVSVQCAASQFSTSDCNTSSKNVTLELHGEPLVTLSAAEANNEEPLTSLDAELSSKKTRPSLETSGSLNSMLTSPQSSQLNFSPDLSITDPIPCPMNTTLDLPPSNEKCPKAESKATDQATSFSKNTTETSLVMTETFSDVKATGPSDMQNVTIDRHSLHKSSSNTFLGDAVAAIVCLQNNTFDAKPKQNDTISFSETSSSDSCRNTFDNSTPHLCNATSSPNEINSEAQTSDHKGTFSNTKMVDTPESTFEVNPAVEVASGVGQYETMDRSKSGLPLTDGLSDTPGHQNMDVKNNKANSFNLDESLDLRADHVSTSTPMTTSSIVSISIQQTYRNKTIMGQKRLYGDGASKPDSQFPSDVPSNIACERKTFLAHPAAKSLLPPSRAASQLLRYKPASTTLSGRFDALTSSLPMTRQRTQALRNSAVPNAPQTSGIPCFSKLRPSTTAATNLRSPRTTTSHTRQSLSQNVLPVTKRKRIDAAVAASTAAETSGNAVSRPRALKQPASSHRALLTKTKGQDCANCVMLERRLKMQSAEIRKLKEELLKKKDKAFKNEKQV